MTDARPLSDDELTALMIELPHGLPAKWGVKVRDHIAAQADRIRELENQLLTMPTFVLPTEPVQTINGVNYP